MSPQESVEMAILEVERTGTDYAELSFLESTLQAGRHGVKQDAIKRLTTATPRPDRRRENSPVWSNDDRRKAQTPAELMLVPPKASSVSAAEKMVELDPGYADHLLSERTVTRDKNLAYTQFTVARLRAFWKVMALKPEADMVLDFDVIRSRADAREQLKGGVPQ